DVREIAVITAAPLFARVVFAPMVAFAADRSGDHRRYLIALSWAALMAAIALAAARGFWSILVLAFLFSITWTAIVPLADTLAMSGVRGADLDYGRMRLWGSLSFIAAVLCGGVLVSCLGAWCVVPLLAGGVLVTIAAAHGLAPPVGARRQGR